MKTYKVTSKDAQIGYVTAKYNSLTNTIKVVINKKWSKAVYIKVYKSDVKRLGLEAAIRNYAADYATEKWIESLR